jgi:hypothetical protein
MANKILNLREKKDYSSRFKKSYPLKSKEILRKNTSKAQDLINFESKKTDEENSLFLKNISWLAPSFYNNNTTKKKLIPIIILLISAGLLFVFQENLLLVILLFMSSLVLMLNYSKKPDIVKINIDQTGISVDNIKYQYKDLKSFWIKYVPGQFKELSLESKKIYMPYVKIILNNQNPILLRSLLIKFIPEKEHKDSFIEQIARYLGL